MSTGERATATRQAAAVDPNTVGIERGTQEYRDWLASLKPGDIVAVRLDNTACKIYERVRATFIEQDLVSVEHETGGSSGCYVWSTGDYHCPEPDAHIAPLTKQDHSRRFFLSKIKKATWDNFDDESLREIAAIVDERR